MWIVQELVDSHWVDRYHRRREADAVRCLEVQRMLDPLHRWRLVGAGEDIDQGEWG